MKKKQVIVLFPGSFKPITYGHISLIQKYLNHPDVKEIKVIIGTGVRNGIDQDLSYEIANKILAPYKNVHIEKSNFSSPITTCYNYIQNVVESGIYALAGSQKQDDYKRVKKFVKDFEIEKYKKSKNVKVIELSVYTNPSIYSERNDEYNGTPISASILRKDILNNDYKNFKTNYPYYEEWEIYWIWKKLKENMLTEHIVNF
jgi:hypothetical protein